MGLFDDLDDEELKLMTKHKNFEPMELTEGNVNAIFNRCVINQPKDDNKCVFSIPFSESLGYSKNSDQALLDIDALNKNKANILYMLGQVKDISKKDSIRLPDLAISYQNTAWTSDISHILNLIYLSSNKVSKILLPFDNTEGKNLSRIITPIEPTLSPKDPNFKEWYKGYAKRHPELNIELDGQEPADM